MGYGYRLLRKVCAGQERASGTPAVLIFGRSKPKCCPYLGGIRKRAAILSNPFN
jgi:hypothetical protein